MDTNNNVLLEVKGLKTHFFLDEGTVRAVDGVDFNIYHGKTLCIVGESGCGKSITARSILQIVDRPGKIIEGQMLLHRNGMATDTSKIDRHCIQGGLPVRDQQKVDKRWFEIEKGRSFSQVFVI